MSNIFIMKIMDLRRLKLSPFNEKIRSLVRIFFFGFIIILVLPIGAMTLLHPLGRANHFGHLKKISILDSQTRKTIISGPARILTHNEESRISSLSSPFSIRYYVMKTCFENIPTPSSSKTLFRAVTSGLSYLSAGIQILKQWSGIKEIPLITQPKVDQWVLLLDIRYMENAKCDWKKTFTSLETAGYSAVILPVQYIKTMNQIKKALTNGDSRLALKKDVYIIDPRDGEVLSKYLNPGSWLGWVSQEKSFEVVMNNKEKSSESRKSLVTKRSLSFKAPDIQSKLCSFIDESKATLSSLSTNFRVTSYEICKNVGRKIFSIWDKIRKIILSISLKSRFTDWTKSAIMKIDKASEKASQLYQEFLVKFDKEWEYRSHRYDIGMSLFDLFDRPKSLETCTRNVNRAFRRTALKIHPDKAANKGAKFREKYTVDFTKKTESKIFMLRKCEERFAKNQNPR